MKRLIAVAGNGILLTMGPAAFRETVRVHLDGQATVTDRLMVQGGSRLAMSDESSAMGQLGDGWPA